MTVPLKDLAYYILWNMCYKTFYRLRILRYFIELKIYIFQDEFSGPVAPGTAFTSGSTLPGKPWNTQEPVQGTMS